MMPGCIFTTGSFYFVLRNQSKMIKGFIELRTRSNGYISIVLYELANVNIKQAYRNTIDYKLLFFML